MTTILVVDDNEQNLYQLQVLLGAHGYQVATAANGAEALALARRNPPALIVSDILMPVMDGFSLCREWKGDERLKAIPFVFYTATYTDERDKEFALGLGAQQFLVKPSEPEDFLQMIRGVLRPSHGPAAELGRAVAEASAGPPGAPPPADEAVYLREYNEVLVRKLEHKMLQLEQANRELERDLAERRRVEEELRESEARFRSVYESSLDAILLTTPAGSILAANPACCQMFGLSEQAVCEAGRTGLVDTADPRLVPLLEERARSGKAHGELTFIRGEGARFQGEVTSNVFADRHGRTMTCMVIRDITERRLVDDALRKSEVRFRSYFDLSRVGLAITSPTAGWIEVNDHLCELLGYSREEICQTTWMALTHPDDLELDLGHFQRVLSGESDGYSIDKRFVRKDGERIWTSLSVRCVRSADGAVEYFVALFFDITERKQAEEAVRRQAEFLQRMIDAMPYPIYYKDRQGRYLGCNRAFEQFFGMAREEITGRTVHEVVPQPLADVYSRADQELFAQPGTQTFDGVLQSVDGVRHDVVFHKATFEGPDETVAGLIGAIVDITDRKKAEAAIRDQLAELRRWHEATLGREGRVLDLKREVNEALGKAGLPPRYASARDDDAGGV